MIERIARKIFIGVGGGAEDVLHMTFVAHQMRMEAPEAEITWAIGSPYAPLLADNPDIHSIIVVSEDWHTEGWQRTRELSNACKYDRKILFHYPEQSQRAEPDGTSRLDCILRIAGIESWLPHRPVLTVREEDLLAAQDFTKANRLHSRNQRIIALEIQSDLLPAPWSQEDYGKFIDLLASRLEVKILLCRGGTPERGPTIQHDEIIDARALTVQQTTALLVQTGDMIIGARGGLTLMAVAAGNMAAKVDLVRAENYRAQDGLAACGYDSSARLVVPKSCEELYETIVEYMEQKGRLPLGRLRKSEVVPMNIIADSDYYNPARDPLVSVLLLARDTENELESCLANLFSQKIPGGLEVIVLDSGSTQDEGMVIERLKEKYHRIRYIRSAREHRYATWNRGIKPARGRYLFLMEAHNRLRAGALVRLAEYLDGHPEVAMVWGDDESVKNPEAALLDEKEARFISRRPTKEAAFIEPNQVSPHLLWRSTLHQSLGLFDPTFEEAGYYEFALRIARVYPVHYVTGVVGAIQETREWEMDRKAILETELKQIRQFYQAIIETGKSQKPLPHPKPAPAISIILPTLGNLRLLTRALESVRQQTWTHYEVIVVNGSDTSLEDSIRASELDEKLRYIGLSSIPCRAVAWNAGLSLAAGRWVAFLHEEGAYYPNHLETLLEAARKSRQPIVYAGIHRHEGFFQGEDFVVTRSEQEAAQPFDAERLYVENFVQLQGMLAERTCLQQAGHFNPYMDPLSDWELMIRLARKFVFHPCEEITSELFCSPPWAGEILAHERIYRRYDELVENRPDIAKARQERLSELCRSALSAQQRSRRTDLRAQELASAT